MKAKTCIVIRIHDIIIIIIIIIMIIIIIINPLKMWQI
jgi:hypothetical protein